MRTRLLLLGLCMLGLYAQAHDVKTAYLQLQQQTGKWHVVLTYPKESRAPVIVSTWLYAGKGVMPVPKGFLLQQEWDITKDDLQGEEIQVDSLAANGLHVLLNIMPLNGKAEQALLTASHATYTITYTGNLPVKAYLLLGVEHIWTGIDHLLFVLGLLLLVNGFKRLLWTITAFTIAHSITLALASLQQVQLPPAPVEAVIALSIVLLATELLRNHTQQPTLTYRYPWLVAFIFGLLHGFGFAGALVETGLPANNIPLALLLFNAGVELGQVAFVAVVWLLIKWLQPKLNNTSLAYRRVVPYLIGCLAAYWFIERTVAIFV
jgi:hypothetical protein